MAQLGKEAEMFHSGLQQSHSHRVTSQSLHSGLLVLLGPQPLGTLCPLPSPHRLLGSCPHLQTLPPALCVFPGCGLCWDGHISEDALWVLATFFSAVHVVLLWPRVSTVTFNCRQNVPPLTFLGGGGWCPGTKAPGGAIDTAGEE